MDVQAINWKQGMFITDTDEVGIFDSYLDSDGEICRKEFAAIAIGFLPPHGPWFVIDPEDFGPAVPVH